MASKRPAAIHPHWRYGENELHAHPRTYRQDVSDNNRRSSLSDAPPSRSHPALHALVPVEPVAPSPRPLARTAALTESVETIIEDRKLATVSLSER